jgi:hypothetical protein
MKNTVLAVMFAASTFGAVATVNAASIPGLYSTGAGLTNGQGDTHYSWTKIGGTSTPAAGIAQVGNGTPIGQPFPHTTPFWVADDTNSHWLTLTNNRTDSFDATAKGTYVWKTTFDLTGFNLSTAAITAQFTADNTAKAYLNNHLIGSATTFQSWFALNIINSDFVQGLNTLKFVVTNSKQLNTNPTGLRVEIQSSNVNAVPVPAAIWLFGSALAGLVASSRRKQAKIAA